MYLEWAAEYDVGVESIDNQHRLLTQHINEIHDNLRDKDPSEILRVSFDKLAFHTSEHFRHEEDLSETTNYPGAAHHARKHRELEELLQRFGLVLGRVDGPTAIADQLTFLQLWLLDHIQKEDKALAEHLNRLNIF